MVERVVLAFSGGLDTSVSVKWIAEKYGAEVVTLTVDLGQQESMSEIAGAAARVGSVQHFSYDEKMTFMTDYVQPSIMANGMYGGVYPLTTALGRPLISTRLVEVAEKTGADAVAHGSTGKGNDQVRFDLTIKALNPSLKIVAPVREWGMSRDQELEYARRNGIEIKTTPSKYSVDQNLWGRSIEGGVLQEADKEPPEEVFEWTSSPAAAPDEPGYVEIHFKDGIPYRLNESEMNPVELVTELNRFAGLHGVGRIDHVEDRLVGIKSREVYEAPAATCIIAAHRDLEKLVLTRHQLDMKSVIESQWAWLVYSGLWMEPLRRDLQAFIESTQKGLDGWVKLKLHEGSLRVVARSSPASLYDIRLATYEGVSTFDQSAALGFIKLWGMTSTMAYGMRRARKGDPREVSGK